ncbi:unknown [Brachyspira sp. CAG:484]|nr:unknown [Brachyspira sp. CAG:484]
MDKKLMRNGTGWAIAINATILKLLEINPETDLIKFTVEGNKLIITKSPNKRDDINK